MHASADLTASPARPARRTRLRIWAALSLAAMGTAASASALEHYADGHPLAALQFDQPLPAITPEGLEALVRTTIEERMTPVVPADARPSTTASERPQARSRRAMR
jgi:hypothetical protein